MKKVQIGWGSQLDFSDDKDKSSETGHWQDCKEVNKSIFVCLHQWFVVICPMKTAQYRCSWNGFLLHPNDHERSYYIYGYLLLYDSYKRRYPIQNRYGNSRSGGSIGTRVWSIDTRVWKFLHKQIQIQIQIWNYHWLTGVGARRCYRI